MNWLASKKVEMREKQENVAIKYSHIGDFEDFKVEVFVDASFGNVEHKTATKSVMVSIVLLRGKDGKINTLHCKYNVIDKVAEDVKTVLVFLSVGNG